MALIESWLMKRLASNDGVRKLIETRVYPIWAPQPDPNNWQVPFVTFRRASTNRQYFSGLNAVGQTVMGSVGLPTATFHVDLFDNDYAAVKALEDAVRLALDGPQTRDGGFQVSSCFIDDEYDIPEPLMFGEQFPIFGVEFVVKITHAETAP